MYQNHINLFKKLKICCTAGRQDLVGRYIPDLACIFLQILTLHISFTIFSNEEKG